MERLTVKSEIVEGYVLKVLCGSADEVDCAECCDNCDNDCNKCPVQASFDRLAAYENTGLSPEEIEQLKMKYCSL